jgi:hypothetical protein
VLQEVVLPAYRTAHPIAVERMLLPLNVFSLGSRSMAGPRRDVGSATIGHRRCWIPANGGGESVGILTVRKLEQLRARLQRPEPSCMRVGDVDDLLLAAAKTDASSAAIGTRTSRPLMMNACDADRDIQHANGILDHVVGLVEG